RIEFSFGVGAMTFKESTVAVIDALDKLEVPYLLVGAMSANYYGVSRLSKDADFVIQIGSHSISDIVAHLGPAFRLDPQMSFETATLTTRYVVDVPATSFMIEFFQLSDDLH